MRKRLKRWIRWFLDLFKRRPRKRKERRDDANLEKWKTGKRAQKQKKKRR